jgi:hypothetical protein
MDSFDLNNHPQKPLAVKECASRPPASTNTGNERFSMTVISSPIAEK